MWNPRTFRVFSLSPGTAPLDRFYYYFVGNACITLAIAMFFYLFTGGGLICNPPADAPPVIKEYLTHLCLSKPLIVLNGTDVYDDNLDFLPKIAYLANVPFFLATFGFTCFLPVCLWKILNLISGVHIGSFMENVAEFKGSRPESNPPVRHALRQLVEGRIATTKRSLIPIFRSRKLVVSHFLTRLAAVKVALFQFRLIHVVFNVHPSFALECFQTLYDLAVFPDNLFFPDEAQCPVGWATTKNLRYDALASCTVTVNRMNRALFIVLWSISSSMLALNLAAAVAHVVFYATNWARSDLEMAANVKQHQIELYRETADSLGPDGLFIMHMVKEEMGFPTVAAIFENMLAQPDPVQGQFQRR